MAWGSQIDMPVFHDGFRDSMLQSVSGMLLSAERDLHGDLLVRLVTDVWLCDRRWCVVHITAIRSNSRVDGGDYSVGILDDLLLD